MGYNYIVFKSEIPMKDSDPMVRLIPIIYPDILVHADVAEACKGIPELEDAVPFSAGSIDGLSVESCSGRSSTLQLKSRDEEDQLLIDTFPYLHGLV